MLCFFHVVHSISHRHVLFLAVQGLSPSSDSATQTLLQATSQLTTVVGELVQSARATKKARGRSISPDSFAQTLVAAVHQLSKSATVAQPLAPDSHDGLAVRHEALLARLADAEVRAAAAEARLDIKQDHVSFEHLHRLGVVPREALVCEACAMNCFCYASCMPCTMCAMCPADRR